MLGNPNKPNFFLTDTLINQSGENPWVDVLILSFIVFFYKVHYIQR